MASKGWYSKYRGWVVMEDARENRLDGVEIAAIMFLRQLVQCMKLNGSD